MVRVLVVDDADDRPLVDLADDALGRLVCRAAISRHPEMAPALLLRLLAEPRGEA